MLTPSTRLVVSVLGASSASFAGDPIVWDNGPYHPDLLAVQPSIYWLTDTGEVQADTALADDFMLTQDTFITGIDVYAAVFGDPFAPPPTLLIEFFASDPSGLTPTHGVNDASTTALATYLISGDQIAIVPEPEYPGFHIHYALTLPTPFTADAGTHYWMSVQGYFDNSLEWEWLSWIASTEQHLSLATWTADGTWETLEAETDFAFKLYGTPVPGPGALALLGVAALARRRWRR